MKVLAVENNDLTLPQVADLARGEPVILTRNGKPLVAVKDVSRSDWESISLANNPRFRALIEESRRSLKKEGGISLEDLRRELKLPTKSRRRPPGKVRKNHKRK
jgi:PHD/YefM family antitoxin component YafN of YafNO toxin-antitoxin module